MKRQRKGSVLCYACENLVSVNSKKCVHCGANYPGMGGYARNFRRLGSNFGFTKITVCACIGLYLLSLLLTPVFIHLEIPVEEQGVGLLSPHPASLFFLGATGSIPVFEVGRWWTVLSAGWLHGDLLHITFNLLWIRYLASRVANAYGVLRLNIIYTLSIISGGVLTSLVGYFLPALPLALQGAPVAVGASGGIFGLFGALVSYGQRMKKFQAGQQALSYATVLFILGFISGNIDNWGHLGGFLGGYVFTQMPWLDAGQPQRILDGVVAIICLGLTALSVLASILHSLFFVLTLINTT
ncbi:MAG: rhomboid family intramembrane serine protease [Cyanobacteria bacterium P01_G01_bin.38]